MSTNFPSTNTVVLTPSWHDPGVTVLHWSTQGVETPILFVRKSKSASPHMTLSFNSLDPKSNIGYVTFPGKSSAEISLRGSTIYMKMNLWSSNCSVDAGHLGKYRFKQDETMGCEALDLFTMLGDKQGQKIARFDRAGKDQMKLTLFRQFHDIYFELLVLTALSAWRIHKKLDSAILGGIGEILLS